MEQSLGRKRDALGCAFGSIFRCAMFSKKQKKSRGMRLCKKKKPFGPIKGRSGSAVTLCPPLPCRLLVAHVHRRSKGRGGGGRRGGEDRRGRKMHVCRPLACGPFRAHRGRGTRRAVRPSSSWAAPWAHPLLWLPAASLYRFLRRCRPRSRSNSRCCFRSFRDFSVALTRGAAG